MLLLSQTIINKPVLSLRTSTQIAYINGFIVNPNNFKIEGFYCNDIGSKKSLILLYQDVRNIIGQGVIVNDHDVLSAPDILVRLKDILKINYMLIGKPVITISKQRVGKVKDFAIDNETFFVQKLYVGRSLIKSLNSGQLSIDRTQIIEVTDNNIIIQDLLDPAKVSVPVATGSFGSSA